MNKGRDILFILILCTIAIYSNHFDNSFHFDDSHTIVNNLNIRSLENIPKFFTDGSTFSSLPANQSYRPVITTLNAIDYSITGSDKQNTFWFHFSIFASFLATGIFVFLFLQVLLKKVSSTQYDLPISLFITGWFWLHPANAETINYIIARSDSFSTCMVMLSFVLYTRWELGRKYHLYLLPFVVGFLSKETAVVFLPLLFLYQLFFEDGPGDGLISKRRIGGVLKKLFIPILLTAALLLLYKQMLPGTWQAGREFDKVGYWQTQPYAALHYLNNFFIPIALVADTDWQPVSSLSDPRLYIGAFFLLLFILVTFYTASKPHLRLISFGLAWFLLALMPTSFIPLAEVINDHRTFFPFIGLFIASGGFLQWQARKWIKLGTYKYSRFALQAGILFFFTGLALGTWNRNKVWHSENSLWKEVTIKAPGNGRGWMNYGITQMQAGDYNGAESSFMKASLLTPGYAYVYINLGILKNLEGKVAESEDYFKSGLAFGYSNPDAYAWYADFLIQQDRYIEADSLIRKGLVLSPNHEMLNRLQHKLGRGPLPSTNQEIIN
jgi:tetratricopeptide (TPR) repeat protein